ARSLAPLVDAADHAFGVGPDIGVASDLDAVALREFGQRFGQVFRRGYVRAADEHGYHGNVAAQGRFHLQAHEIVGDAQALAALGVRDLDPLRADHGQGDLALSDRVVDHLAEVDAERNRVHVAEDVVGPEVRFEAVVDAAGDVGAVVAAVGEEEFAHSRSRNATGIRWCGTILTKFEKSSPQRHGEPRRVATDPPG